MRNSQRARVSTWWAALLVVAGLVVGTPGLGQQKKDQMKATITVEKVDPAARIAYVKSKNQHFAVHIPADMKIEQIKQGDRYTVSFSEPVVTAMEPGAPSASAGATRELQTTGKEGENVVTGRMSGKMEVVDAANRQILVRTDKGELMPFRIGEGVDTQAVKKGEPVTLTFRRAVSTKWVNSPESELSDPFRFPSG